MLVRKYSLDVTGLLKYGEELFSFLRVFRGGYVLAQLTSMNFNEA